MRDVQHGPVLGWEGLSPSDRDQALEIAEQALLRRASLIAALDPTVARALRQMMVELEERFPVVP